MHVELHGRSGSGSAMLGRQCNVLVDGKEIRCRHVALRAGMDGVVEVVLHVLPSQVTVDVDADVTSDDSGEPAALPHG